MENEKSIREWFKTITPVVINKDCSMLCNVFKLWLLLLVE